MQSREWDIVDVAELRYLLRRYAPIGIATFAVCMLLGMAAAYVPARSYVTHATVTIEPGGPSGPTTPTTASVSQVNFALPALQERASAQTLKTAAAEDVPEELRDEPVRVSAVVETSVLKITGTGHSPEAVAAYVNAMAQRLTKGTDPLGVVRLTVLDLAVVPTKAVSPKASPILFAAAVFGVISAIFVCLLVRQLRSSSDPGTVVRERFGAPVLGEIPRLGPLRSGRGEVVSLLESGAPPELRVAFEQVRTNLEIRLAQLHGTGLAVVAADAGVGCSTVAAGLGHSLASVGRDVVLIESDLRVPVLAKLLGVPDDGGLGAMAVGAAPATLQSTRYDGLQVLTAGQFAGRAADVVSAGLPRAVEELRSDSRLLVIDTPPQREAPEAVLAAALAGAVVLVVGPKPVDQLDAASTIRRLEEAGAVLVGVVVNGVSMRRFRRAHRSRRPEPARGTVSVEELERRLADVIEVTDPASGNGAASGNGTTTDHDGGGEPTSLTGLTRHR